MEGLFTLADLVTRHIHRAAQSGQLKVHTVLVHFLAVQTKKEACVSGEWSTGRGWSEAVAETLAAFFSAPDQLLYHSQLK